MGAKDITEKIPADYNDVFADIINGVLFDGEQVVSENELENVKDRSQYKFNNKIFEQERDVCKHWISHKISFSLYGLEHQTETEPFMPMRIIGYDAASYRGQLTKSEVSIGEKRGISIGEKRGREKINQLNAILLEQNRIDDLKRAVADADYQKQLMAEYGISYEDE